MTGTCLLGLAPLAGVVLPVDDEEIISGYASATSVVQGGQIALHVSTVAPAFDVLAGAQHAVPDNMVGCEWDFEWPESPPELAPALVRIIADHDGTKRSHTGGYYERDQGGGAVTVGDAPGGLRARVTSANAGTLTLVLHDAQGRTTRVLYTGPAISGSFDVLWNGRDERGQVAPRGVYFLRARLGGVSIERKVVWLPRATATR